MLSKDLNMIEVFKNLTKSLTNFFDVTSLKKENISCSEFRILEIICENAKGNKKVNVTEIANELRISKSAVSQSVSKLEKKGLIKRKINIFDQKINYISLSNNSIKKYEEIKEIYINEANKVLNEMGIDDSKELSRLLDKLNNIINELGKDDVCA